MRALEGVCETLSSAGYGRGKMDKPCTGFRALANLSASDQSSNRDESTEVLKQDENESFIVDCVHKYK